MTSKVTISTQEFVRSHGRKPKGWGGWIFAFGDPNDAGTWRNFNGTFAKARKAAKEAASSEGIPTIHVMP